MPKSTETNLAVNKPQKETEKPSTLFPLDLSENTVLDAMLDVLDKLHDEKSKNSTKTSPETPTADGPREGRRT